MANDYAITGGYEGRERLRLLSEVMGPSTRSLLSRVGIPVGGACLDVGCGGGDVSLELARLVGPSGRVVGVDLDAKVVEIARREVSNVTFEVGDVANWEPKEQFDVVYMRFLLTHLPDPGALLASLYRHLRPGGVIVVEDVDFRGHFYEPECRALDKFVHFYNEIMRKRGVDPVIGPKLPGLLRAAGFNDVQMGLFQPTALKGGIKLLTSVTMELIAPAIVNDHVASDEDVRQTIRDLYTAAQDPNTVHGGPRVFQVFGRK